MYTEQILQKTKTLDFYKESKNMIATDARDDGFEYGCRNKSRRFQMLLTLLSLRTSFVHTLYIQILFFKNKKAFENGGKRSALARDQRPRPPHFKKFFVFEEKYLKMKRMYKHSSSAKQGQEHLTSTGFIFAPIFKSIVPSTSCNHVFALFVKVKSLRFL